MMAWMDFGVFFPPEGCSSLGNWRTETFLTAFLDAGQFFSFAGGLLH